MLSSEWSEALIYVGLGIAALIALPFKCAREKQRLNAKIGALERLGLRSTPNLSRHDQQTAFTAIAAPRFLSFGSKGIELVASGSWNGRPATVCSHAYFLDGAAMQHLCVSVPCNAGLDKGVVTPRWAAVRWVLGLMGLPKGPKAWRPEVARRYACNEKKYPTFVNALAGEVAQDLLEALAEPTHVCLAPGADGSGVLALVRRGDAKAETVAALLEVASGLAAEAEASCRAGV